MLRGVLFDWGGTLMDDEWSDEIAVAGHAAGLDALAREALPDAEPFTAYLREHEAELFLGAGDDEIDISAVMRASFHAHGVNLNDDDLRLFLEAARDSWSSHYSLGASTHALLEALRGRGLKLALVSNTGSPLWLLAPILDRQGITQRVDTIVLSSEVGKRKPHPAIFERALEELDVDASEALFVGDRLKADIVGASRVGMRTAQALWFRADESLEGVEPDYQAFTQMDILNVVDRLAA